MSSLLIASLVLAAAPPPRGVVLLQDPAPGLFMAGKVNTVELAEIDPGIEWDEMVPSWNLDNAENAALTVEARVIYPDKATKWYSFGPWTLDPTMGRRASVDKQKDADGNVLTDTLRMVRPGGKVQVRLTARAWWSGALPSLRLLALSFAHSRAGPAVHLPRREVWGRTLEPPQRAQGDYPNGKVLCSPTCTSMVLGYWSKVLNRPELDVDVPAIERSVWDPVYNGAGNWSYNVAMAGSKPGMVGFVARLSSVGDLENWIAAGVPVVCSASWYLLHGEPIKDDELGHLVVLVGFTEDGDPVFNDPGKRGEVRRTYKRSDFEAAWNYSKRTVYLVYPREWKVPGASP